MAERPIDATHGQDLSSTADIVKFVDKDTNMAVWRVVVTNSDGNQYISDQYWLTQLDALEALKSHIRALGATEQELKDHRVH